MKCEKCGGEPGIRYHEDNNECRDVKVHGFEIPSEHLHYICTVCGHEWTTPTLCDTQWARSVGATPAPDYNPQHRQCHAAHIHHHCWVCGMEHIANCDDNAVRP